MSFPCGCATTGWIGTSSGSTLKPFPGLPSCLWAKPALWITGGARKIRSPGFLTLRWFGRRACPTSRHGPTPAGAAATRNSLPTSRPASRRRSAWAAPWAVVSAPSAARNTAPAATARENPTTGSSAAAFSGIRWMPMSSPSWQCLPSGRPGSSRQPGAAKA